MLFVECTGKGFLFSVAGPPLTTICPKGIIELAKQLVKEYLSVEWDPNCRSVAKVQRIIDFENEE